MRKAPINVPGGEAQIEGGPRLNMAEVICW